MFNTRLKLRENTGLDYANHEYMVTHQIFTSLYNENRLLYIVFLVYSVVLFIFLFICMSMIISCVVTSNMFHDSSSL